MRVPARWVGLWVMSGLLGALLAACGGGGADEADGGGDASPDEDDDAHRVFALASVPDELVEIANEEDGSSPDRIPASHLVLYMDERLAVDEARAAVAVIAQALGGEVVGQIPPLGMYQLLLPTTTTEELDAAAAEAEAWPGVEGTGYNVLATLDFHEPCENDDDVSALGGAQRCAYEAIQYGQAATLMDAIHDEIELHPVRVVMVDSAINNEHGQFDDVKVVNLDAVEVPPHAGIDNPHGSLTTGLIAADDGDGLVNGVATRLIGTDLVTILSDDMPAQNRALFDAVAELWVAVEQLGAQVVNMSLGWRGGPHGFALFRERLHQVMARHREVLFVCSAGNDGWLVTETNRAPAGMPEPNLITVGGLARCDVDSRWELSGRGPLVDIAAPAVEVAEVGDGVLRSGNSLAAPLVTALAAVLLSIDPTLTAEEIKRYILTYSYPTSATVGGRRLVLVPPIAELLIDRSAPPRVLDIVDRTTDLFAVGGGAADTPGLIVERICAFGEMSVDGYGSETFPMGEGMGTVGDRGEGMLGTVGQVSGVEMARIGSFELGLEMLFTPLRLFEEYAISEDVMTPSLTLCAPSPGLGLNPAAGCRAMGQGTSGTATFTSCRVIDRGLGLDGSPAPDGDPISAILLEGFVEGSLRVYDPWDPEEPPPPTTHSAEASFYAYAPVFMADDTLLGYLEEHCVGGLDAQ